MKQLFLLFFFFPTFSMEKILSNFNDYDWDSFPIQKEIYILEKNPTLEQEYEACKNIAGLLLKCYVLNQVVFGSNYTDIGFAQKNKESFPNLYQVLKYGFIKQKIEEANRFKTISKHSPHYLSYKLSCLYLEIQAGKIAR